MWGERGENVFECKRVRGRRGEVKELGSEEKGAGRSGVENDLVI